MGNPSASRGTQWLLGDSYEAYYISMDRATKIYIPKWAGLLYGAMAIVLVPWIFDVAQNLPTRHIIRHWDAVWVGFDVILLFTILLTLWFLIKKTVWVVMSASALATLFIVDTWFDILTSRPGREEREAIAFGVLEVSLALLTYRLVYLVIRQSTPEKNVTLAVKDRLPH
jgi:hypothetical protein